VTPWLIVVLHAPWYNTNHAHQGDGDAMKKAVEELLYEARVDLVVTGHVHAYERTVRFSCFSCILAMSDYMQ
jgi:Icc-related predicted phosphoesterase